MDRRMPSPLTTLAIARTAQRLPMLKALPLARLLLLAEVGMLAKDHFERLEPHERRRLVVLVTDARGRPSNLTPRNRRELERLIEKVEPKRFASSAVAKFSPLPARKSR